MSINHVNLPNNECFMNHSISNCLKNTFPRPKLTKIPFEAWRFAFFSSFPSPWIPFSKTNVEWNGTPSVASAAWPTMLRHQAAENSLTTSGAAKKELFSSRDNCSCWSLKLFERTSYFLGIQAWVLRQNEKQKKYAHKSGQRSTFSILIFLIFIISQNACLNFFKTAFELLLYRKCGKKV